MPADKLRKAVGRRVREARTAAALTREQLAERLKIHPGSIARWESGGSMPQPYYMERIAEITNAPASWLQFGEGARAKTTTKGRVRKGPDTGHGFDSFDGLVRFIASLGEPREQKARKLDALEGYRRMLTASGVLPDWWYHVQSKVERDEL